MLVRPTETQLRALDSLARQPIWDTIAQLLKDDLLKTQAQLTLCRDSAEIHQLQGRAQWVHQFLGAVAEAPNALQRAQPAHPRRP